MNTEKTYECHENDDGSYRVVVTKPDEMFVSYGIPIGYECDGASVPLVLRPLFGSPIKHPRVKAAIIHDWMYDTHVVDRNVADTTYLVNLLRFGTEPIASIIEYLFIRLFGWMHWDSNFNS